MKRFAALFGFLCLCLAGCGRFGAGVKTAAEAAALSLEEKVPPEEAASFLPSAGDAAYSAYREEARVIAASLEDRVLAGQVLMSGIDGREKLSAAARTALREIPPGGIMLFKYNLNTSKEAVRSFLDECVLGVADACGVVPFIAVDHEGGLVHRFGADVEKLPPASSYWDMARTEGREAALKAVETSARDSAAGLRGLGITMNFAPVAEVLDGENGRFLETRSYGPDSLFVTEAASAFIRGMDAAGIAAVVKHFPGNSGADPHTADTVLEFERSALDAMVRPFADIIKNLRPPAIMVSHALVPALDSQKIASVSPAVLKTWLRGELGFDGVIIADDFSMAAAGGIAAGDAAVSSLAAGADMVMVWPRNAALVHAAILKALLEERLPRGRLLDAASRIITEKLRYGLAGVSVPAGAERQQHFMELTNDER